MLRATSEILYIRASLKPLARQIKAAGGIIPLLKSHIQFDEFLVPHFYGARPFWRAKSNSWSPQTNSGPLGKLVAKLPDALLSAHPSHPFVGIGPRVIDALRSHDESRSCFAPIGELADRYDFSMLLLGCVQESPGFSTVHAVQSRLGLSQRHFLRLLMRWDTYQDGMLNTKIAQELPGCSASFSKFYSYYEATGNLVRGEWYGVSWLFVPSARSAMIAEAQLLREDGRFVDCGRWNCLSCRLRFY